jgi:hypothetical protein
VVSRARIQVVSFIVLLLGLGSLAAGLPASVAADASTGPSLFFPSPPGPSLIFPKPKALGKVVVGSTVRIKVPMISKKGLTYAWFANGKKVAQATSSRLTLTRHLKGKTLKVKVTLQVHETEAFRTVKVGTVRAP